MSFADHFSGQAADYTVYRPHYPAALFDYLASLCEQHEYALDCATGNGQAAQALLAHFQHVIGCEPSLSQLANAMGREQIGYVCSTAEQLPFNGTQFDLLTVAQAVHWFDHKRFYSEADRILKLGGVLAVWGYGLFQIEAGIDAVIHDYYQNIVGPYWPPQRRWIEQAYQELPFPYAPLDAPLFQIEAEWNRLQVVGYLATWSATQRYKQARQQDPLPAIEKQLAECWPDEHEIKAIHWPIFLRVGRKM